MIRHQLRRVAVGLLLSAPFFIATGGLARTTRPLRIDDLYELKDVGRPRLSPDGEWVAYTVTRRLREPDRTDTDVWMVPAQGGEAVRLTSSDKAEKAPSWSPDGRYLAFLSDREGTHTQVWLLDRRGGDARRLSEYRASVAEMAWSPDGRRLAVVVQDPDPADVAAKDDKNAERPPRPIVVRRLQFKRDGDGYLTDRRSHVHILDAASGATTQLTSGPYDDSGPAWSPDGRRIAFVSNRTPDPDANDNTDIFVVDATGGDPRALTRSPGPDDTPVFTPDGAAVVYVAGGDPKDIWYATTTLATVRVGGGSPQTLTAGLDRNVSSPHVSSDGRFVLFLLEDAGNMHLARMPIGGGAIERVVAGDRELDAFDLARDGRIVVRQSEATYPAELFLVGANGATRITHTNDAFLAGITLGPVERFEATSRDGTRIDAFLTRPPGYAGAGKLPTILRIHGGPVFQYGTGFALEWQMLAAQGFAVVGANPRGSSGYGRDFSRAIWADWGNKDYEDVMAAVDRAIEMGVADPDRLGVGGWSYGGILTNYVITKTSRFKAAISGASEVNYLANYGTDHYQREWEQELGLPWVAAERWMKMSPFFAVEKVTTPTLILCGQDDMNVPLLNSEQLYQALRRLGRETELVIYPGQTHAIERPSFQKDRLERYVAWYGKYLRPSRSASGPQ